MPVSACICSSGRAAQARIYSGPGAMTGAPAKLALWGRVRNPGGVSHNSQGGQQ